MIVVGDCRTVMAGMEAESVDSVVCDPPYGIGFMGREWDVFAPDKVAARASAQRSKANPPTSAAWPDKIGSCATSGTSISYDESPTGNQRFQAWATEWATECLRVLKPGGHMVVFGGTRTYHRLTCGLEDAGFEIRDVLCWLFGSGFPKSHNLDGDWSGWGSALKPGYEPIVLCRKPLSERTIAANVDRWGTGALNIDSSRISVSESDAKAMERANTPGSGRFHKGSGTIYGQGKGTQPPGTLLDTTAGRWPANVVLDEDAAALLDDTVGTLTSGGFSGTIQKAIPTQSSKGAERQRIRTDRSPDSGGPSRFFYTAKVSRLERNAGLQCTCYNQAWENQDHRANILPETDTRPLRATIASTSGGAPGWPMLSNGSDTTAPSLTDPKSTTITGTSKIIVSRTSSWSTPLLISDSTADVSCETASGGSRAAFADDSSQLTKSTGTSTDTDGPYTVAADHATSRSSSISVGSDGRCPGCGNFIRSIHPTVKPIALCRWLVRLVTPPSGLVLDPFTGSGSTGIAAALENMRFIGVELNEEYAAIAERRIAHWRGPLFAEGAP